MLLLAFYTGRFSIWSGTNGLPIRLDRIALVTFENVALIDLNKRMAQSRGRSTGVSLWYPGTRVSIPWYPGYGVPGYKNGH